MIQTSDGDTSARLAIEHVELSGIGAHPNGVVRSKSRPRGRSRNDSTSFGLDLNVRVRSDLLHQTDPTSRPECWTGLLLGCRVEFEENVLAADPQEDSVAGSGVDRDVPASRPEGAVADDPRDDVHGGNADKCGDEEIRWCAVDVERRPDLLDAASIHDHHRVREAHRLRLIVRDVDKGPAKVTLEGLELEAHVGTQLRIKVAEWLVEQERRRSSDDGTGERDPLLLSTGQLAWAAFEQFSDPELGRDSLATRWRISSRSTRRIRSGKPMFSRTDRFGYRAYDWKTMAMSR